MLVMASLQGSLLMSGETLASHMESVFSCDLSWSYFMPAWLHTALTASVRAMISGTSCVFGFHPVKGGLRLTRRFRFRVLVGEKRPVGLE